MLHPLCYFSGEVRPLEMKNSQLVHTCCSRVQCGSTWGKELYNYYDL